MQNKKTTLGQVANLLITLKGHVTQDWWSLRHLLHIPEQISLDPVYIHSIASVSSCNMLDSKLLLFFAVFGTQRITQKVQGMQNPMHIEIWKVHHILHDLFQAVPALCLQTYWTQLYIS